MQRKILNMHINMQKTCRKHAENMRKYAHYAKNVQKMWIYRRSKQYAAIQVRICRICKKNMQKICRKCSLCKPCHQYAKYAWGTLLMESESVLIMPQICNMKATQAWLGPSDDSDSSWHHGILLLCHSGSWQLMAKYHLSRCHDPCSGSTVGVGVRAGAWHFCQYVSCHHGWLRRSPATASHWGAVRWLHLQVALSQIRNNT